MSHTSHKCLSLHQALWPKTQKLRWKKSASKGGDCGSNVGQRWRRKKWNCHLSIIFFIFTKEICMRTSFYRRDRARNPPLAAVNELVSRTAFCYCEMCLTTARIVFHTRVTFLTELQAGSRWGWPTLLVRKNIWELGQALLWCNRLRGEKEAKEKVPRMHSRKNCDLNRRCKSAILFEILLFCNVL